ncbi:ATP-binding protein [Streptomyces nigra]|uniref:sensor histidine kinase n=1 Tax=Streptomyces nigra TaxID=1827580 RepID=UPI0037D4F108
MSDSPLHPLHDSRRGGRHRKNAVRNLMTAKEVRLRLLRLVLWPPVAVMLLASAGTSLLLANPFAASTWLGGVLACAGCAGVLAVSVCQASGTAGKISEDLAEADLTVSRWLTRLHAVVSDGRSSLELPVEATLPRNPVHAKAASIDRHFRALETALLQYQHDTGRAVSEGSARQQEQVFVSVARRLRTLVTRALAEIRLVEREAEDPELMDRLVQIDHLVTRVRRVVQSLAVLGGAVPRRTNKSVAVQSALHSAVSEIEDHQRVRLLQAAPPHCQILGHVAADVIHLLAELVENAAQFSPPDTTVDVRVEEAPAGLVVEIDDRGLLMPALQRIQTNQLLASPEQFDLTAQLSTGRIGLYVVAYLAQRHQIRVEIQTNVYGGNQAVVLLPRALLLTGHDGGLDGKSEFSRSSESPAPQARQAPAGLPSRVPLAARAGQPVPRTPGASAQPGTEAGAVPASRLPTMAPSSAPDTLQGTSAARSRKAPLPRRGGGSHFTLKRWHSTEDRDEEGVTVNLRRAAPPLQDLGTPSEAPNRPGTPA